MPFFEYKAIDAQGKRHKGRLSATNLLDLEHRLQHLQLELIHGTPAKPSHTVLLRSFPRKPLIHFWFHLEQLIKAGVSLVDGLRDLREGAEHPRLRAAAADLVDGVEGGKTLSQALLEYPGIFDPVFTNLIQAGEESGRLPEVIDRIVGTLKWEDELASHTLKLLLYPAFLAISVFSAMIFLLSVVVPQLKDFISNMGQSLPLHTKALFLLSDLLNERGWLILSLLPVPPLLLMTLPKLGPSTRLFMDRQTLKLPLIGKIIGKLILSRFASTLAMLYAAGIPILTALRTTQGVMGNRALSAALSDAENAVRNGKSLADAFEATTLFPTLVVRMLRVGESTGSLDTALLNISYFYNRDVQEAIAKTQALIEPTMTLGIGALLAWLMLSVMGPIYDIVAHAS